MPSITSAASRKSRTGTIRTPSTALASAAFATGTMSPRTRLPRANKAMAKAPRTARTSPSKANSPTTIHSAKLSLEICPEQASSPNAMGRSKQGPPFFKSAGAKLAVINPTGQEYPLFQTAAFTLWRDSFTAVSAKPTTTKFSFPPPASTSTSTGSASTPTTAADQVLANCLIGSTPPRPQPSCRRGVASDTSAAGLAHNTPLQYQIAQEADDTLTPADSCWP